MSVLLRLLGSRLGLGLTGLLLILCVVLGVQLRTADRKLQAQRHWQADVMASLQIALAPETARPEDAATQIQHLATRLRTCNDNASKLGAALAGQNAAVQEWKRKGEAAAAAARTAQERAGTIAARYDTLARDLAQRPPSGSCGDVFERMLADRKAG